MLGWDSSLEIHPSNTHLTFVNLSEVCPLAWHYVIPWCPLYFCKNVFLQCHWNDESLEVCLLSTECYQGPSVLQFGASFRASTAGSLRDFVSFLNLFALNICYGMEVTSASVSSLKLIEIPFTVTVSVHFVRFPVDSSQRKA